jgi:hypothetical protein
MKKRSGAMKKTLTLSLALLLAVAGCNSSNPGPTSVPGHGAISIEVIPNPIVATQVSGNLYDFPFEVVIRETGGRPVTVQRVTATVGLGALELARESWDADRIRSLGYNTTLGANSETRYRFAPRKEVPDDRLFGGVSAQLRVDATDDTGTAASATTSVTVRR